MSNTSEGAIQFYAVVVIYNTSISDSDTINRLRIIKGHQIEIIAVDNSTRDYSNEAICRESGWTYISMYGNAGLSKAYNKALDYICTKKSGIVVWFDDDTEVTQEYFDTLELDICKYQDVDVFAPMIRGQDGRFWSPNSYRYIRNKQIKKPTDNIPNEKFNAINSCTAVRTSVYEDYRYTEKLFLDQVDHQFFEDQREKGTNFRKLNIIINHNFSTRSNMESIEKVKIRYGIMIPDFLVFCNKSKGRYFLGWIKIFGWGIRETIKYKNLSFFTWCIKTALNESKKL